MSSNRTPIAAGLLAIALIFATVPFVPTGSADGTETGTCDRKTPEKPLVTREEGYIATSHPMTDDTRASVLLKLLVWENLDIPLSIQGSPLDETTNGQDAYVVHLGCLTDGNELYCLYDKDPAFKLLNGQITGDQPDIRIQFYNQALREVGDEVDHDRSEPCSNDGDGTVPPGAHYAVVYLRDGHPTGTSSIVDVTNQPTEVGLRTLDFTFELKRV
jgi:hypothetical protein